jgi:hypothetical protein
MQFRAGAYAYPVFEKRQVKHEPPGPHQGLASPSLREPLQLQRIDPIVFDLAQPTSSLLSDKIRQDTPKLDGRFAIRGSCEVVANK